MTAVRSAVYSVYYYAWMVIFALVFLPGLGLAKVLRRRMLVQRMARIWAAGLIGGVRLIGGIRYEIRGRENILEGPVIFAVKHQSAAETHLFHLILRDPVYVLKKELADVPVLGWYLLGSGGIAVDRKAGPKAAKAMVALARERLAEGGQIVIFPEGTRVPVGTRKPYQPGVAILYAFARVPIVPVALNTGAFWPRDSFLKKPGTMVIEFLEPIPPGQDQKTVLAQLEQQIDTRSEALLSDAGTTRGVGQK